MSQPKLDIPALPPLEALRPQTRKRTPSPDREPGRTPYRSTVVLDFGCRQTLEKLAISMRAPSGRPMSHSEILRALVRALGAAPLDLRKVQTEDQLAELLQRRLAR